MFLCVCVCVCVCVFVCVYACVFVCKRQTGLVPQAITVLKHLYLITLRERERGREIGERRWADQKDRQAETKEVNKDRERERKKGLLKVEETVRFLMKCGSGFSTEAGSTY